MFEVFGRKIILNNFLIYTVQGDVEKLIDNYDTAIIQYSLTEDELYRAPEEIRCGNIVKINLP